MLDLGSPRQRTVLALLLVYRNSVVATDRLVDFLWGSRPPTTAANTLHVFLSGIRRALDGDESASPLVTRRPGYELHVERGQVDLDRFDDLRAAAEVASTAGEYEAARDCLRDALALWRGDPLPELVDVADLAGELGRLRELRWTTLEERIDADMATGRHHEIVPELEALVAEEPLRERLRAQLMLALYRSGRQSRALEVYREGRRRLVDELGVEPGPELRALEQAILRHDAAIGPRSQLMLTQRRRRAGMVTAGVVVALAAVVLFALRAQTSGAPAAVRGPGVLLLGSHGVVARRTIPAVDAVAEQPDGVLWAASTGDGTITSIAPSGAVHVAGIGGRPTNLAWGFGKVWVGEAPDRRLLAYDPIRKSQVLEVPLSGGFGPMGQPAADIAVGAGSVWVDEGGSAGVLRINPTSGRGLARVTGVETGAIAYGLKAVWVGGDFFSAGRIDRIDPASNRRTASIALPSAGVISMAVAGSDIWVVTDDGALWRVDPSSHGAVPVSLPGRALGVAARGNTLWASASGPDRVIQIDPATSRVMGTIPLAGAPTALIASGEATWVATVPQDPNTRSPPGGGTVRVALNTGIDSIDPAEAQWATAWQLEFETGLRLLTYPDAAGPAGQRLVGDGASGLPVVSNSGRTYTFMVRRGLRFWPGRQPVTAYAFRAAVERATSRGVASQFGRQFMWDLVGLHRFEAGKAAHIAGIRVLGRYTIAFTTKQTDPSFVARIAMPQYSAVPPSTPDVPANRPLPSAGPYYIDSYMPDTSIVLRRNPGYVGPRPAVPGEIRYRLGGAGTEPAWEQVARGQADVDADPATPQQLARLRRTPLGAGIRVRVDPTPTVLYLEFNAKSPALNDARVRRAIADAINRRALADTMGPGGAVPTDQYLPPAVPGYPGSGLVYPLARPRIGAARRLLRAAHIRLPLTLRLSTCNDPGCIAGGAARRIVLLRRQLGRIGIHLRVSALPRLQQFRRDFGDVGFDIADEGWVFPETDGDIMVPMITEGGYRVTTAITRALHAASPGRSAEFGRLDLHLASRAVPLAAFGIGETVTLTSQRVGCVIYQQEYGLDLGRLCQLGVG
jgi:ABC-type transport system substrate-binding protein/DNA-binding SARP family transcriptional activator